MDPITIGLAFAAAQSAVGHIKQAIALGKDVNSLIGQFSKFFESSDTIHREKIKQKAKAKLLGKTDAELGKEALQIAMHSDALKEQERELKDMIIWQLGKPQIWENMISERNRLIKERTAAEQAEAESQFAHKKKMTEIFMFSLTLIGSIVVLFALTMGGISIYSMLEEKKIYEEKIAARARLIRIQEQKRAAEELKARDKAIGGG